MHSSTAYKLNNITKYSYSAVKCEVCNSFAQWGVDNICTDFLDKYWDYDKNKNFNPWKIPFRARPTTEIWIKCQYNSDHESYKTYPDHFVEGYRCPTCTNERSESYLQEQIRLYLENNYEYKLSHEYGCSIIPYNYESKHYMPFDNDLEIQDGVHLIIECHGKQHYEITQYTKLYAKRSGVSNELALQKQQERDNIKRLYALSFPGYYYIAISYKNIKDNSYKTLIDDKIQEILTLNNTKQTCA